MATQLISERIAHDLRTRPQFQCRFNELSMYFVLAFIAKITDGKTTFGRMTLLDWIASTFRKEFNLPSVPMGNECRQGHRVNLSGSTGSICRVDPAIFEWFLSQKPQVAGTVIELRCSSNLNDEFNNRDCLR